MPIECDVVIAGAGLSGLVTGAVLSQHGVRVVLVDQPTSIGGRGGGTPHRGYWLDAGQRDGRDVTDLQIGWRYGQIAAREAGVEVPLRPVPPSLRVHLLDAFPAEADARVIDGGWDAKGFASMACEVGALTWVGDGPDGNPLYRASASTRRRVAGSARSRREDLKSAGGRLSLVVVLSRLVRPRIIVLP